MRNVEALNFQWTRIKEIQPIHDYAEGVQFDHIMVMTPGGLKRSAIVTYKYLHTAHQ
jgi:hypothetical protein